MNYKTGITLSYLKGAEFHSIIGNNNVSMTIYRTVSSVPVDFL